MQREPCGARVLLEAALAAGGRSAGGVEPTGRDGACPLSADQIPIDCPGDGT